MIVYSIETLSQVRDEIEPLLADHYKEVAMYQDKIDLNVDWEFYERAELEARLIVFTFRDEETRKLIGYNVFFINNHPHYKDHTYAVNDIVYIAPEYRHTEETFNFFKWCEDFLANINQTSVVTYHMKPYVPFHTLMNALEMDHAEYIYSKYIGK